MFKKAIAITTVLILALTFTACSGGAPANTGKPTDGGNSPKVSAPAVTDGDTAGWPAAGLPAGFPVYPGGTVTDTENDGEAVIVLIEGTDSQTYEAYKNTLQAAGWVFEQPQDGSDTALNGGLLLAMYFDDGLLSIAVGDAGLGDTGWPADLPFALPVYPEGAISAATTASGDVWIEVAGTSRTAYDKYLDALTADGWEIVGDRDKTLNALEKDGHDISVSLDGDSSVSITVFSK